MATLTYDLDAAEELVQPSPGWHPAILVAAEVAQNKAGTGFNIVLSFELAEDDPERPGMPWTLYVPLPSQDLIDNYQQWVSEGKPRNWDITYMSRDGRHKYSVAMARLRRLSSAFGGPETGKFNPGTLSRYIGTRVKINLQPERDDFGELTGRLRIAYDGIAPA